MTAHPLLEPIPTVVPVPAPLRGRHSDDELPGKRLLLVDDEDTIRLALGRFLRSRGYEVQTAADGAEALELLRRTRFHVLLCDVRMPGMSGLEVVPLALREDPDLAITMLTAVNDAPTAAAALGQGAMHYLMKPIEPAELERAVERMLHQRELVIERRHVERLIREEVALRTEELEREKAALRQLAVSVVDSLINAQEAKDVFLRGHSQRVAALAASIAEELGLDADTVEGVRLAGRLHDVGKIGLREEVLNKPGALTAEEFAHVQTHVGLSLEILRPIRHLAPVLPYVADHHEHWDGSGYPLGKKGTEISIGGRILVAADAFDALTSRRAYREPMSPAETVAYLATHVGTLLDPDVYQALARVVGRRRSLVFIDEIHG